MRPNVSVTTAQMAMGQLSTPKAGQTIKAPNSTKGDRGAKLADVLRQLDGVAEAFADYIAQHDSADEGGDETVAA